MEKDEIAAGVLAYLADHPDAEDTFEGIIGWWLLEIRIKQQAEILREVLGELVRHGRLEEISGRHGVRYRLAGRN